MDFTALEIFKTVVEQGGINKAAARLHRVPSNVTTRIKQLEEQLDTKLFARERGKLHLSAEGKILLTYADRLLRLSAEAEAALRSGKPRGTLRIGALESTSAAWLPPVLSRYHRLYPDVGIELVTGTSGALVNRLHEREIEAAFVTEPFNADGLEARFAFVEEIVLVTPKSYPRIRSPKDIGKLTVIAFASGCSYRRRLETWLGAEKIHPDRVDRVRVLPRDHCLRRGGKRHCRRAEIDGQNDGRRDGAKHRCAPGSCGPRQYTACLAVDASFSCPCGVQEASSPSRRAQGSSLTSAKAGIHGTVAALIAATCLLPACALGQSYPTRSIRLIVPFVAAGTTDTVSRIMAQMLSASLGQQVIIDNRAGATGAIGTSSSRRPRPTATRSSSAAPARASSSPAPPRNCLTTRSRTSLRSASSAIPITSSSCTRRCRRRRSRM